MPISVDEIFRQKVQEIQSRIPVKLNILENDSFGNVLEDVQNSNSQNISNNLRYKSVSTDFALNKGQILQIIEKNIALSGKKYDINPNLIRAIIKQESSFNPYSLSSAGAQGLMQLMPGTAEGLGVVNPWDIAQNIDGGTQYLKYQLDQFGSVELALAAYNAGPAAVKKYSGVPPYNETQNYVRKVLDNFNEYEGSK